MAQKLIFLAVIAYLPGALIYRAPIANRARRALLPADERAFWAVMISIIVSSTVAMTLAAMNVYTLEALLGCDIMIGIVVALGSRGNLRLGSAAPGIRWRAMLPAALIAGGAWMYFAAPAAEYVLGGRDPGVYISEGIQMAQRGSLITTDPMVAAVPPSTRDLFFPSYDDVGYYSIRFMGFHLRDPEAGTVSGQFPQGYPTWIAIAYGIDGLTGTRRVSAWWAILGVLAVYFAAARLLGPLPAGAAAAMLMVHVIQTWYARYPNSEIVTQPLLFAALLGHTYAHEEDDRFFGPVAASLLGLALFTRIPAVLAIGAAVAASLIAHVSGHRARAGFLITLAAWIAAAGFYYTTQLRPYFSRPITYLQSLTSTHLLMLGAGCVVFCALLWAIRKPPVADATRKWLPLSLIGTVTVGGLYALFFRESGGRLAVHDAHAVRSFAHLYFTPTGFGLALLGYALIVWRSFWRAPALILTFTTFAFFFFYKLRITPEQFWLARRFLDVILPFALVCAAAAALLPLSFVFPGRWASHRGVALARIAIGLAIVALLGATYLRVSIAIQSHIEYAGIIPRLERMAGRFGDDDLVLVEGREASDVHVLALPLAYIYARNVLVLYRSRPDKASILEFLTWARQRYKNVYFIAGGGTDLLSPGVGAEIVESERFQVPEYQKTAYDVYPRAAVAKPFDFTIYRLVAFSATAPPQSLDIGAADDLHLVDFHPKERLGGRDLTFRWAQDVSDLLMGIRPDSRAIVLRLSSGRPPGVPLAHVTVSISGTELGSAEPTNEFRDYVFPIPAALASQLSQRVGPVEIRVQSSTWVPRDILGGNDTRRLGVMVDRAEVR